MGLQGRASGFCSRALKANPAKRKTYVQTAVELVQKGRLFAAEMVCQYGRLLSDEEAELARYYELVDRWGLAMKGKSSLRPVSNRHFGKLSPKEFIALHKEIRAQERHIADIYIQAVNEHDSGKINLLADAVQFLKNKHGRTADRERAVLMFLKILLDEYGGSLTLSEVARFLAWERLQDGGKLETPADGWSALRRKCRQLRIPIKESKKNKN